MKFNEEALKKLEDIDFYEIDINAPWHACEDCGKKTGDVKFLPDPFIHEIKDIEIWRFLCKDCIRERCMDI